MYLIYLSIWSSIFIPQVRFETESIIFPVHTKRQVKILQTYSRIFHPLFPKYPLQHNSLVSYLTPKFSPLFQGYLHNPVWPLSSTYPTKKKTKLPPIIGWPHKTLVWSITNTLNFQPLYRGRPSQNQVWLLLVPKISIPF